MVECIGRFYTHPPPPTGATVRTADMDRTMASAVFAAAPVDGKRMDCYMDAVSHVPLRRASDLGWTWYMAVPAKKAVLWYVSQPASQLADPSGHCSVANWQTDIHWPVHGTELRSQLGPNPSAHRHTPHSSPSGCHPSASSHRDLDTDQLALPRLRHPYCPSTHISHSTPHIPHPTDH